jgi:GntR family transcriptional regulator
MEADLLNIQPGSSEPIYRQIIAQLQRLISSGQLPPGEPLPSVRDVAGVHGVNPVTVSRAYTLLEAEGFLDRRRGIGMVVASRARRAISDTARLEQLDRPLKEVVRQARELDLSSQLVLERLKTLLKEEKS